MSATLTEVLSSPTPTEPPPANPVLRVWEESWASRRDPCVRVEQTNDNFGPAVVTFVLTYTNQDGATAEEEPREWEYELNQWLVEKKVSAIDEDNEKLRFAVSLRAPLQAPMTKVGDGFFNSVLVELVNDAGLTNPELGEVLKYIRVPKPPKEGDGYLACRQWILITTERKMYDLQVHLGYSPEQSGKILAGALARYLDHRFSVSSRKRLGLL